MAFRAIALVALLLLAGCSLPVSTEPPAVDTPSGNDPVDRTADPTAVTTAAPVGERPNPYGQRTLVVAVENGVNDSREFRPLVRAALDYWEDNAERYAGYAVDYRLASDAVDADVVVRFVDDVSDCGREDHVAGCAPYVTSGPVERPVEVRVSGGFSDESTIRVLQHELGHTLGLGHDDAPQAVMAPRSVLTTLPQRDAADRALPWNRSTLSVYVDAPDADATRRQVDAALGYFADDAEGTVPGNVSFVRTDDPGDADVVIRFADSSPCQSGVGSCGRLEGLDPDGDGALETYTRLEITLSGLDTDAVAWHVARWLGHGLGLRGEEYPDPLRESASYGERRGEWWH